jgi:tetratricopeptide (TPR) repeat protein
MSKAGYDPREAAKVWSNLLREVKAIPGGDPSKSNPLFATHPSADERMETLARLANELPPGGSTNETAWMEKTAPYRRDWLDEEIKRGHFEESLALLSRLVSRSPATPDYLWARGEVYRMHGESADLDAAVADFKAAAAIGGEPAEVHRGLGMVYRSRHQAAEAKASFTRYLELVPQASDSLMIKNYMEEAGA